MAVDYPHLGFDPVASDERTSDDIARDLRNAVSRLGEVNDVLSGTGDQEWHGKTAEAFRSSVDDELRPRVNDAYQSFSTASRAFDRFAADLPGWRSRANALEAEAEVAAKKVQGATTGLTGLTEPGPDADDAANTSYQDDLTAAKSSLRASQGELSGIITRAHTLRTEVEGGAGEVASAFNTAMDLAPDEPGLFDRLGDALSDLGDILGEAFDWVMENVAPILQKLAKIVGAIATILSIVCFVVGFIFPPAFALAGTMGTIAKVASFVDLGIQGLRVLHGEEGALQGFVVQAGGMLLGMGAARAIGPIAMNAQSNIRNGLFVPVLAGVNVGAGGSAVATAAIQVNSDFVSSLGYWGVTAYQDLTGSADTLQDETR